MLAAAEQDTLAPGLDTLAREAEALTRVLHALEAEHDALITSDAERLESAIADKNDALEGYMTAKSAREAVSTSQNLETLASHPQLSAGQRATGVELTSTIRLAG